jgi:hypothetical protein
MLGASDPGCRRGIHVGSARDGKVKYFDRLPPVWAAFRGSAGSGTVLFCGSGDEKCPQVQLWAQVRENGGDTGRGLKR